MRRSLGLAAAPLPIADRVAVGQITVSSPEVLKPLEAFNAGKPYAQQIKPFNFILSAHVAPFGHPSGADPEHFHLIAPYESDPRKWERLPWIDEYSEKPYRISASLPSATRSIARVKSYGDVLEEYEFHEEAKCADASGEPCDRQSVGLLGRRHVRIEQLHFIGKESNKLEEVEEQSVPDAVTFIRSIPIRGATSGRRRFYHSSGGHPLRLLLTRLESAVEPFSESETNKRNQQPNIGGFSKALQKIGTSAFKTAQGSHLMEELPGLRTALLRLGLKQLQSVPQRQLKQRGYVIGLL